MTMANTGVTTVPRVRGLRLWQGVFPAVCRRVHSPGVGGRARASGRGEPGTPGKPPHPCT
jgi:hypothetical protein